ncbi:branched-chain amino acid ABC transporter permease [Streptosporangium sp. NPDC002524]|uniref:branched-chain amino acid ABC transporter permease n=1 Tax=Streptosporangium sp. NPDC002524 TaxID=3154537 RepID=UPI00331CC245
MNKLRQTVSGPFDAVRNWWWYKASGWQRAIVYVALLVLALSLPSLPVASFMSPHVEWQSLLFFPIGVYVLLALGLNIVVGQAGLLDLGFVAFYAIGAYFLAYLGTESGWNFWVILPIAVLMAAVSGIILGAPTLRLRGDYLAIVTLGFGEIVRITAMNTEAIGGTNGIAGIPHPPNIEGVFFFGEEVFKYGLLDSKPYYYLLVLLCAVVIILSVRWNNSRVGRAWAAIREDEDAAEVMGVPTYKFKLLAFAIGAAIGGATGVFWAGKTVSIVPQDFPFMLSATILAAVVLGGSGNIPGVMLGAFMVAWLPERFRGFEEYRIMVFGAVLVAMMVFRPEGLLPSRRRKAELKDGTGGMGSLGAEVGGPDSVEAAEVAK